MKTVNSSCTRVIIDDILKRIELCGKVCYQSSHNITDTSAKGFIKGICSRGHTSVLEHAPMYFVVKDRFDEILEVINIYEERTFDVIIPYIKYNRMQYGHIFVSTTPRVIYNLITLDRLFLSISQKNLLNQFLGELKIEYPELFDIFPYVADCEPGYYNITKSICIYPELARETYNVICDRGIQNEFVRHRNMSFSVESTRYCLYSKEQFSGITIVESDTMQNDSMNYLTMIEASKDAERWYMQLVDLGEKAQIARKVLPLALKTEMYMSGYVHDWNKVFKLRSVFTAHPEIRVISKAINQELNSIYGNSIVPIIE